MQPSLVLAAWLTAYLMTDAGKYRYSLATRFVAPHDTERCFSEAPGKPPEEARCMERAGLLRPSVCVPPPEASEAASRSTLSRPSISCPPCAAQDGPGAISEKRDAIVREVEAACGCHLNTDGATQASVIVENRYAAYITLNNFSTLRTRSGPGTEVQQVSLHSTVNIQRF